jgi:hypothetical protein
VVDVRQHDCQIAIQIAAGGCAKMLRGSSECSSRGHGLVDQTTYTARQNCRAVI